MNVCAIDLLNTNDKLLQVIADIKQCPLYISGNVDIDLTCQVNVYQLPEPEQLQTPPPLAHCKQRSQQWHTSRSQFMLTGSTLYAALGLDGLKKQQMHISKVCFIQLWRWTVFHLSMTMNSLPLKHIIIFPIFLKISVMRNIIFVPLKITYVPTCFDIGCSHQYPNRIFTN